MAACNDEKSFLWSKFNCCDVNALGTLDARELVSALSNGSFTAVNIEEAELLIEIFDKNQDHRVTFDEFCKIRKYVINLVPVLVHYLQ